MFLLQEERDFSSGFYPDSMPRKMMVVLQLERLGDLAQSLAALRCAARAHDETLLVLHSAYTELARQLVPGDVVLRPASKERVLALQDRLAAHDPGWRQEAARLVDELELPKDARVVNLGWHRLGLACASAMGEPLWGGRISSAGEQLFPGPFASYLLTAVDIRPHGRLHIADLRRLLTEEALSSGKASGSADEVPERDPSLVVPRHLHGRPRVDPGNGSVILAPSSSQPQRRLAPEALGRLARALSDEGYRVEINATEEELPLAKDIIAASSGAAHGLPTTLDLPALAEHLSAASLVVGADTGPLHLACALGTPVVMLLTGGSHTWETGPLAPGSVALQAPLDATHGQPFPDRLLRRACLAALAGEEALDQIPANAGETKVWLRASADEEDSLGGVVYRRPGQAIDEASRLSRALLARLAGRHATALSLQQLGSDPEPARVLARGASALEGLCTGALRWIEQEHPAEAVRALARVTPLIEGIVSIARQIPPLAPVCVATRNLIANLPAAGPVETIRAHQQIARRLTEALHLALG